MKLPIEAALLVLGFLRRQTLGRVLVANYRLSGIVNRHRKALNLPEIPIPPRLSTRLKSLALLAVVTLLLLAIGILYAGRSTQYKHPSASGTIVDIVQSKLASFKRHFLMWTNLLLALLASVFAVKLLWMDRRIADEYMAATSGPWRDSVLKKHAKLRKLVIGWCIAGTAIHDQLGWQAVLELGEC
ncbi:hypothetical protein AAVH_21299 [Aphelenchoides avenae]|nr:hypothetical protein AAVH_21299 [Aphelenchus avenae]